MSVLDDGGEFATASMCWVGSIYVSMPKRSAPWLRERCLQPGASVAGLAANLLRKWIMRYQQKPDGATTVSPPKAPPSKV